MPKYLIQGNYSPEGLEGLAKDTASGRKAAVQAAVKAIKGKLECLYFALGVDDIVLIIDAPDNVAIAALSMAVGATGMVTTRSTPLLTVAEIDEALKLPLKYRAPGE